ncbi:copper resistance protein CopC [Exiguobacterium sp. s133]|uniref:copper resistance CopC family protein n=1 Tax=Exiguobacterium sp. s133 TaxID=2751213 RepID=UPI001BE562A6|nr:copper resistance protein CopC [Exiguobacterium sp. s133]
MPRINYLVLLLSGILLWCPVQVSAHTGLESSTPQADETVLPTKTITLDFETNIEAGGSIQVFDSTSSDALKGTFTQERRRMTFQLDRELTSGRYRVEWKIVGTDGHPIEGTYLFNIETQTTASETSDQKKPIQQKDADTETVKTTTSPAEETDFFPFLVAGGLLIMLLFFLYQIVLKGRTK